MRLFPSKENGLYVALPVVAATLADSPFLCTEPPGFPWPAVDPLLLCVCHNSAVPGFAAHPHWGFETATIVRQSLLNHSGSGAAAYSG